MKKMPILGIFTILLVSLGLFIFKQSEVSKVLPESQNQKVLGIPKNNEAFEIEHSGKKTSVIFVKVENADNITLVPNFNKKNTSESIYSASGCKAIVSGGFYKPEGSPLGLFLTEGAESNSIINSSLFNAVYSINNFATPRITGNRPKDELRIALQAGPLLFENGEELAIRSQSEDGARRIVVATTGENTTIFLALYNPASVFMGPKLSELPALLQEFEAFSGEKIADAMNLDGGTASFFFTEDFKLPEAKYAGSYFCIN